MPGCKLPDDPASRLWLHFHQRERKDRITHLILDQFEEIFTLGAQRPGAGAELRQVLAILVQGAIPAPVESLLDDSEAFLKHFQLDVPPLRVLLSLRQDYVFALNRWRSQLPALGQNSFELGELGIDAAIAAVFKPGELRCRYRGEVKEENKADTGMPPIVTKETAERIVRFVARKREDLHIEDVEAVPPILSLLCQELNLRRFPQPPAPKASRSHRSPSAKARAASKPSSPTFTTAASPGVPKPFAFSSKKNLSAAVARACSTTRKAC